MYFYHGYIVYSLIAIYSFKLCFESARLQVVMLFSDPRVVIFYTSKDFYTPVYSRNCFGVLVRGDPGKGVLDA